MKKDKLERLKFMIIEDARRYATEHYWKTMYEHYQKLNEEEKKEFLKRMFPDMKKKKEDV